MNLGLLLSMNTDDEFVNLWIFKIKTSDIEFIINKSIKIVIIIALMYLAIRIGNKIINKFVKRQIQSNAKFTLDTQKAKTLGDVLKSGLKYATYFIGVALILTDIFSGVSVAIASVGGVALGFGAQSLVKDVINGFFILFEEHYGIGDYVTIGNNSGIVSTVGIRTTVIKDFSGDVHLIPNGAITQVTNHSKSDSRFIVEVNIAYKENIEKAIEVITEVCKKFKEENEDVTEPIEVAGITAVSASAITIKVVGKSKPLKQWGLENNLRKEIKIALDKEGIEIPYSKIEIIGK